MLGGPSAATIGVLVVSCLQASFGWQLERVGRRAGCRCIEPWGSPLQKWDSEPCGGWRCQRSLLGLNRCLAGSKTRLGRSKGILIPLLWHALPEGQSTPHDWQGGSPSMCRSQSHRHVAGIAWDKWLWDYRSYGWWGPANLWKCYGWNHGFVGVSKTSAIAFSDILNFLWWFLHVCMCQRTCIRESKGHTELLSIGKTFRRCQFLWNFPFSYLHKSNSVYVSRSLVFAHVKLTVYNEVMSYLTKIRTQTSK